MAKIKKRTLNPGFMVPMYPSKALAVIVGNNPLIRTEVIKKVWDYVKKRKLQDTKERRNINCDSVLKPIMGNKSVVSLFEIAKFLNKNLSLNEQKEDKMKNTKFKIGDKIEITAKKHGHGFNIGDVVEIYSIGSLGYSARNSKANWVVGVDECKLANKTKPSKKMANATDATRKVLVLSCAQKLLSPNNTVTTLEIKTELRKTYPQYYWTQDVVSKIMNDFSTNKVFTYTDNGTYRTYSNPTRKTRNTVKAVSKPAPKKAATAPSKNYSSTITKSQALKMMMNNKGHFFTATFIKADNTSRTMNCQYLAGQVPDNKSVKVREACLMKSGDNAIRQITLDRLKELKIAGSTYKVRK